MPRPWASTGASGTCRCTPGCCATSTSPASGTRFQSSRLVRDAAGWLSGCRAGFLAPGSAMPSSSFLAGGDRPACTLPPTLKGTMLLGLGCEWAPSSGQPTHRAPIVSESSIPNPTSHPLPTLRPDCFLCVCGLPRDPGGPASAHGQGLGVLWPDGAGGLRASWTAACSACVVQGPWWECSRNGQLPSLPHFPCPGPPGTSHADHREAEAAL